MTRYVFAKEGYETINGVEFKVGSIKWSKDTIPVVWGFDFHPAKLVGTATDIRREEDHTLTAEIEWHENSRELMEDTIGKYVFLTISVHHLVERDRRVTGDTRVVISGDLMEINAVAIPANPGATLSGDSYATGDPWRPKNRNASDAG